MLKSNLWRRLGRLGSWTSMCMLLAGPSGCSRSFWREQADKDSYLATTEKLNDPRWAVPRIDLNPDPRSRFYDPHAPDCEPLPPDDPAANVYMNWVDGWQGYKGWHKFGDSMTVENPQWLANFGVSEENVDPLSGEIVGRVPALNDVTLTNAVELAQIHNRDYQFQIEEVYLAALAVTFQRFQFGVRYLGANGAEPNVGVTNTFVPHGPGDNTAMSSFAGVSQVLPAGTQWAMEFANNTIWLFGGGSQTSTLSTLSFSIVQPLLFGAGRKVGLEGLTQTERNLLYQARDLARFRQVLFTNVVGGGVGYLSLLQQLQAIRNARGNIARQEEQVQRLLAQSARNSRFAGANLENYPADLANPPALFQGRLSYQPQVKRLLWSSDRPISDEEVAALRGLSQDQEFQEAVNAIVQILRTEVATLDVLNLASNLANSMNSLRQQETRFQDDLDNYKLLLGLTPTMELTIDDSLLKPFEIIDPRLAELEQRGKDFVDVWGLISSVDPPVDALRQNLAQQREILAEVISSGLQIVEGDLQRVQAKLPERIAQQRTPEDAKRLQSDLQRSVSLLESARMEVQALQLAMSKMEEKLSNSELALEGRQEIFYDLGEVRERLVQLTQNLSVIQSSMRVELIEVQPFKMSQEKVVQLALENRVDLMNARALVMDSRRRVEIAANALQASLDLVVQGDLNTPNGTKPFDFRGENSRLRVGLGFDAPLDQIDERNVYRRTLLDYQRQRREYMLAEDQVKQDVRVAWRQLLLLTQNLETSRQAVRLAALQYDSAVQDSRAPVQQRSSVGGASGGGGGGGGSSRSGAGVQGNNLLQALNALLRAQNDLVGTWTNYERNRLNIYRDMGIMEIGEDGVWNDPIYRSLNYGQQSTDTLGPLSGMDSGYSDPDFAGWGSVGIGNDPGLVEVADRFLLGEAPVEPGARPGAARPLPRQPASAGKP